MGATCLDGYGAITFESLTIWCYSGPASENIIKYNYHIKVGPALKILYKIIIIVGPPLKILYNIIIILKWARP